MKLDNELGSLRRDNYGVYQRVPEGFFYETCYISGLDSFGTYDRDIASLLANINVTIALIKD